MSFWSSALDLGSKALDVGKDLFSTASGYAGKAFDWVKDHPEAAQVLGGVAVGAGQGYIESRNARKERELQRELLDREIESRRIAPGEMGSGYGSYRESVTQGLISNGMLASADEED